MNGSLGARRPVFRAGPGALPLAPNTCRGRPAGRGRTTAFAPGPRDERRPPANRVPVRKSHPQRRRPGRRRWARRDSLDPGRVPALVAASILVRPCSWPARLRLSTVAAQPRPWGPAVAQRRRPRDSHAARCRRPTARPVAAKRVAALSLAAVSFVAVPLAELPRGRSTAAMRTTPLSAGVVIDGARGADRGATLAGCAAGATNG